MGYIRGMKKIETLLMTLYIKYSLTKIFKKKSKCLNRTLSFMRVSKCRHLLEFYKDMTCWNLNLYSGDERVLLLKCISDIQHSFYAWRYLTMM